MQRHKDLLFLVITINLQVWLGTLEDTSPDRRIKLLLKKEEKKKKRDECECEAHNYIQGHTWTLRTDGPSPIYIEANLEHRHN